MKLNDKTAREQLITHNIKLVIYVVNHKFIDFDFDKEELISIGTIGLIKAVDSFKLELNREFSTYAARCIENEILMYLRKIKNENNIISLDEKKYIKNEYNDTNKLESIPDDVLVEDLYIVKEEYEIVRKIIEKLPELGRRLIELYFGFNGNEVHKQIEISQKLNLHKSFVCRNLKRILETLKKELEYYYKQENSNILKRIKD